MKTTILLTGDLNFMGVESPNAAFGKVKEELNKFDVVIGNLECCFFEPRRKRKAMSKEQSGDEGFYVTTSFGRSLLEGGFKVVGTANNQNYGEDAILASNKVLQDLGILNAGSGANREKAKAPVVYKKNSMRIGFLQRTSIFWPVNHEAGENLAGVAAMKAYTAYQPPYYNESRPSSNRPGLPARIITWTDPQYLQQIRDDIKELKKISDFVVCSLHWGHKEEVLQYQAEIAHAVIDSGADVVMGHGPHYLLPIEVYKKKPIFYGLGSFCFLRDNEKSYKDLVGMVVQLQLEGSAIVEASFQLSRQKPSGEIQFCHLKDESNVIGRIEELSKQYKTRFKVDSNKVRIEF